MAERAGNSNTAVPTNAAHGAAATAAMHGGTDWESATRAVLQTLGDGRRPDLLLVFIDSRWSDHYEDVLARLSDGTGAREIIGASGLNVVGQTVDSGGEPAISVIAFSIPGARFAAVRFDPTEGPKATARALGKIEAADVATWLMFADPFTVETEELVNEIGERSAKIPIIGGLASAGNGGTGTAVFAGTRAFRSGAVLLGMSDHVQVHALVAQGAEPIGQPWIITECEGNLIRSIASQPAFEVLRRTLGGLDKTLRERAKRRPLLGLAMDEQLLHHGVGDYLIRDITGADRKTGTIAINGTPHVGQTVQFHFRDPGAAEDDMRSKLRAFRADLAADRELVGALLCACAGRAQVLFESPDHDAAVLAEELTDLPIAGLLCGGEVGPVGGKNHLHGYTAVIAIITAPAAATSPSGS